MLRSANCKVCDETLTGQTPKDMERGYVKHIKTSERHAEAVKVLKLEKDSRLRSLRGDR
jgi:hypothetical protein